MYLKSIEVHGFKSFANKINFQFHDGITAIVGPNGSGKSNVGDAVRWVLGEQSAKQLRGSKMEDVIFSGTETRKPMGYAYVAITLDNSDHKLPIAYDEVTVARRVYRSGESEYLINGSSCRLRDVQELFLDTGIGKEGYSIIGQGQIDKILSGKPEDRRELFDEAAGIVKFKKRKNAAEKNLEEERLNLNRINDILSEIEKQIGPLEQQSITAKEYLKLRDELKVLDVNLFLMENERIESEQNQMNEKISIGKEALETANNNYECTKEEYDKLELEIEECNQELEINKNSLHEFNLTKEKQEGEIKVLNEQILAIKQSDSHYQSRISAIRDDIQSKNEELEQYRKAKQEIDSKIDTMDEEQTSVLEILGTIRNNISNCVKQIEDCNSEIFDFLSENATIKTSLQRYETILEQNNIKKVELNQKLLRNKSDEAIIESAISQQEETLKTITEDILKQNNANSSIETLITEIQNKIDSITITLNERQQEFHRESSRLESLKNLTERYEGYGNSIRKVMEQKDNEPGILGAVADIIKVDSKYEIAIETALGGNIQNIVTENEVTAKRLIEYLKKNKFGRATFLPLTSISNKETGFQDRVLSEKGVIGLASTLVSYDTKFSNVIQYLLGRNIVVDHIDNGIILAKKYNQTLRIVTLDGELISPGGSLSGGAYKNSSNLLGRRREIDELEGTVSKLDKNLKELAVSKETLKSERMNAKQQLEDNKSNLQNLYLKQNTVNLSLNQELGKKQEGIRNYNEFANEIKEIELQTKELNINIERLKEALKINEEKSKENELKIEEFNRLLDSQKAEEQVYNDKVSTIRIEFSSLEQRNQNILENIKRVKKDLEKLYEEENNLKSSKSNASKLLQDKVDQIQQIQSEIELCNSSSKELEEKLLELTKTKENISLSHKSFFQKREQLSKEINELDKECFRLSGQLEKLNEQHNEKINYMWEEYELTFSSALELKSETVTNLPQTKKIIADLKIQMKNLGDVNVNAIEDFKNLSERYIFMKTQRDDLLTAEETLIGIIKELDDEMRKQFDEKFHSIKVEFDKVFKELFGGGKATLELTEEEDILEAGIIITSQPPGKKLQNMMQLSGGEKALTAISLLFAIQNLKPSPFCLLDEIEAALDDANVKRFAKYLHKLTRDTQFIIITHRRGTMAAADILYGITMQEKGVSTLVSVNLIEDELDK
jgi:chromosome segregation protein